MNNMFPSLVLRSPEEDAELPALAKDAIFKLQNAPDEVFEHLNCIAYILGGVVGHHNDLATADKIQQRLQGMGIFTKGGDLDTSKIDAKFNRGLPFLSVPAQRRLIGVLFFWEEEIEQRHLLLRQVDEIRQTGQDTSILERRLDLPPSVRDMDAGPQIVPAYDQPPPY